MKRTLTIIVTQLINKLPLAQFKSTVAEFFEEFFDTKVRQIRFVKCVDID